MKIIRVRFTNHKTGKEKIVELTKQQYQESIRHFIGTNVTHKVIFEREL